MNNGFYSFIKTLEINLTIGLQDIWEGDINPLPPSDAVRQQKIYFTGFFQFSIVTIQKLSPLWKPEIELFRPFCKA